MREHFAGGSGRWLRLVAAPVLYILSVPPVLQVCTYREMIAKSKELEDGGVAAPSYIEFAEAYAAPFGWISSRWPVSGVLEVYWDWWGQGWRQSLVQWLSQR